VPRSRDPRPGTWTGHRPMPVDPSSRSRGELADQAQRLVAAQPHGSGTTTATSPVEALNLER
jgi:hypothetical protein